MTKCIQSLSPASGLVSARPLIAAVVAEALGAAYWKPVQAGFEDGTDSEWVGERISLPQERIQPEAYKLALPASPHIAARKEGLSSILIRIVRQLETIKDRPLVIEGAGGLFVPLNDRQFIIDLIRKLDATVLLVSRNYFGSINHSLLTASRLPPRRSAGRRLDLQRPVYALRTGNRAVERASRHRLDPFRRRPQQRFCPGSGREDPTGTSGGPEGPIAKFAVSLTLFYER